MFGLKKVASIAVAIAALAVPSLALADDYDHREPRRDDHGMIERLRAEIRHDKLELRRDLREHRWAEARAERREIQRREWQLERLTRGDRYER